MKICPICNSKYIIQLPNNSFSCEECCQDFQIIDKQIQIICPVCKEYCYPLYEIGIECPICGVELSKADLKEIYNLESFIDYFVEMFNKTKNTAYLEVVDYTRKIIDKNNNRKEFDKFDDFLIENDICCKCLVGKVDYIKIDSMSIYEKPEYKAICDYCDKED